jgi:branched-chain amino acid transport system substrate-binding protein
MQGLVAIVFNINLTLIFPLILPHIDRLHKAFDLAKANKGKLSLYGNSTLATIKTLEQEKASQGLTLVVPWSSKTIENMSFAQAARQLWGGDVSWRSAGNYDATHTVATGLKQSQNRQGLQKALESPNFISKTINGEVKFLSNGDRAGQATIVQVKPSSSHPTGYDFMPVMP